jgi:hypothetical protein
MAHGHSHGDDCGHAHGAAEPIPMKPEADLNDDSDRRLIAGLLPTEHALGTPAASLREEFYRAESLYHHVVDDIGECEGEHNVGRHETDALGAFTRCSAMVRADGIFSSNETLEDIATSSLQYLLIEFYIAALRQRRMTNRCV